MKKLLLLLGLTLFPMIGMSKTIVLSEDNTIGFNSKFSGSYIAKKQIEAMNKCYKNPNSEITIVLYSPGGSVSAGKLFFDTLNALSCKFNTLTVFSASMAYQTVQNLGKRYILPSGVLMSHRAYVGGLSGEINGELDAILNLIKTNVREMEKVAAKRVGITLEKYKELVRDELWMTGSQAVEMGHADEVVLARCDRSLNGTHTEHFQSIFGSLEVKFSNCPLVTYPVAVRASREAAEKVNDYFSNIKNHVGLSP